MHDENKPSRELANIYTVGDPASYSSAERVFQRARGLLIDGGRLTRKRVVKLLLGEQAPTLHRQKSKQSVRYRTYLARIEQQWQAYLADSQAKRRIQMLANVRKHSKQIRLDRAVKSSTCVEGCVGSSSCPTAEATTPADRLG